MIEQFLPTLEILGFNKEDIQQYSDDQFDYLSIDFSRKGSIKLGTLVEITEFFIGRFDISYKMCEISTENNKITIKKKK